MIIEQSSLDSALVDIRKQYDMVNEPIFLSALSENNWKTELYNKLSAARKDPYCDSERIAIVQDINDIYDYDDSVGSPGQYLLFIQQILQQIDITNFFVLIITPNPYIENELISLKENYSTDSTSMQYYKVDGYYKKQQPRQDTFCILPWMHFYLSTNGSVLPCCISDRNKPLGNLKNNSVKSIFNGSKMNQVRKNMLNGHKSVECQNCYIKEENNLKSKRQRSNKNYKSLIQSAKNNTNEDGSLDKIEIIDFHLGLNSVCNLMCRTCSGVSSTKLAGEEKKILNLSDNFSNILTVTEKKNISEQLVPYIHSAEQVSFAGGEPTRQQEHYNILDELLKYKKQNTVSLEYSINFTTLTYNGNSILDYWNKFTNIMVAGSIDGHGKKFEYIRHGAKWDVVENNFLKLKKECPHVNISVNSVVSFLSIESIMELQRMWHKNNILSIENFEISLMLENSGHYEIQSLPQHHKTRITKKIDNHCDWLLSQNNKKLFDDWVAIKTYMNSSDKTYLLHETKKDCELRDKARGVDFYEIFPELRDVFNI